MTLRDLRDECKAAERVLAWIEEKYEDRRTVGLAVDEVRKEMQKRFLTFVKDMEE